MRGMSTRKYTVNTMTIRHIGHCAEDGGSGIDHIIEERPARTVESVGDPLLQMETVIESADGRGVVLGLLNVMRRLVYQLTSLLGEWGNRGGHEGAQQHEEDDEHQGGRRPPRKFAVDEPGGGRFQAECEKERHADEDQCRGHGLQDMHHPVGDRDPGGRRHPDKEGGPSVKAPPQLAEGPLVGTHLGRRYFRLGDRTLLLVGVRLGDQIVMRFGGSISGCEIVVDFSHLTPPMPRQSGRSCSDGAQVILLSPRSIRAASRRTDEVCVVASLQPSQSDQPE